MAAARDDDVTVILRVRRGAFRQMVTEGYRLALPVEVIRLRPTEEGQGAYELAYGVEGEALLTTPAAWRTANGLPVEDQ